MTLKDFSLKKRILVTGSAGLLGQQSIVHYSQMDNVELMCCDLLPEHPFRDVHYTPLDLTKREDVKNLILDFVPDVIINAAAFTNVDRSESDRETAWKVNVRAVENLAESARIIDAFIVHISSDYVFDGTKGPYNESDTPCPINYYGRTKLASENALRISGVEYAILRTNVLYGTLRGGKLDFVKWVVESIKSGKQISIVTDQINNPTFVNDLVQGIDLVIDKRKTGLYHIGGREFLSRFEFTLRIAKIFGLDESYIIPIITESLNQPALRPLKSGLYTLKAQYELGFNSTPLDESLLLMKKELSL